MSRELLPEGDYVGTIRRGWDINQSFNGKNQFTLPVRLTHFIDEETGEKTELATPVNRDINLSLAPANIAATVKNLHFLGYTRSNTGGLNPKADDAFDFLGKPVGGKVQHGEWKGKATETVWFSTKGIEQAEDSRKALLSQVDELFAKAVTKVNGRKDFADDGPDDDDVPADDGAVADPFADDDETPAF